MSVSTGQPGLNREFQARPGNTATPSLQQNNNNNNNMPKEGELPNKSWNHFVNKKNKAKKGEAPKKSYNHFINNKNKPKEGQPPIRLGYILSTNRTKTSQSWGKPQTRLGTILSMRVVKQAYNQSTWKVEMRNPESKCLRPAWATWFLWPYQKKKSLVWWPMPFNIIKT